MSAARTPPPPPGELPQDGPADVEVSPPRLLADAYRAYERFDVTVHVPGSPPLHQERDVLRAGHTVGILLYDPDRDSVVLIRQFRLPAFLMLGAERAELVEIVAGGVEKGEEAEAAARRECVEETGLAPRLLVPMLRFLPTPGIIDEYASFFLGIVDATNLPERGGMAGEAELTRPFLLSVDRAIAMVAEGRSANGYLVIALQWLALNRARLPQLIRPT
ncbi:MAG: NUDIX domain-containing protein [Xanthobacter sp.]